MRLGKLLWLFPFAFLLLTVGFAQNNNPQGEWILTEETVAVVNGEPILLSDVRLYRLLFGVKDFKTALDRLIDIYLVSQYAKERGLSIPPQKVEEIISQFAQSQGITVEELYRRLQKLHLGGSVFTNFIERYNLYVGAINLFVLKPLYENKEELSLLVASRLKKAQPYYTVEILKIPKSVAEKNEDLLLSMDIQKISQRLGISPIKLTARLEDLKPQIAQVVKRLSPQKVDFAEDKDFLYLVKLVGISYKTDEEERQRVIKEIEAERIKKFIDSLRKESVVKILVPVE
jgi:DNA-binding Lrp family transcriptional regulator